MPVARGALVEDFTLQIVERGKERDRPLAGVVVGAGADVADAQRQPGLGALQRLALTLFVAAKHQRLPRRLQVEADDVPKLRLEKRVARDFESARAEGLEIVARPELLHLAFGNAGVAGHSAQLPAR